MTHVLPDAPASMTVSARIGVAVAVGTARVLHRHSPKNLKAVLNRVSAGADPATYEQAKRARDEILTASPYCRGSEACLVRSLAVTLLCRMRGHWPTWAVGVLAVPPFAAHAWLEAEGSIVDEPLSEDDYRAFFKVAVSGRPEALRSQKGSMEGKEV